MQPKALSRADDRKKASETLCALAAEVGATAEVDIDRPREVYLTLRAGKLKGFVSLDAGDTAFMCSWVSTERLCASFGRDIGGSVNAFHGRKATTVTSDWDKFCKYIRRGLELAVEGSIFEGEEE
jgi:hypothetical protein